MSQEESKKKILIVDDELSITKLLSAILKNHYQLAVAQNCPDTIIKTFELQPDLITLDINMPGLHGDELLPVLRAWKPQIPILVISASQEPGIQGRCLEKGASSFLAKPFDKNQLLEQIEKILKDKVPSLSVSEDILREVEIVLGLLEKKELLTNEQVKEEINKIKSK
ncbi:MAG: CheY-like chemotaxis protein [Nitrospinales bacterium]|jgi:CheY-like chemotaxis protein